MQDIFDPRELYSAFRADAAEQLSAFYARLAAVRGRSPSDEDWTELYRPIHTIKGGGAILGLRPVAEVGDAMCRAIRRQRANAQSRPSEQFWETLDGASRALEQIIEAALSGEPTAALQVHVHLERLATGP